MVMMMKTPATNTRLREGKCDGRNERMNITYIYIVFTGSKILLNKWERINYIKYEVRGA